MKGNRRERRMRAAAEKRGESFVENKLPHIRSRNTSVSWRFNK